ncbi:unnamed protein product [Adineta steineri]|uniref:Uncharacterized protein n=2 Tax=Adineta steineri TaxID=433720 RepID=A0A819L9T6_9BILA|nr:unnamed protein product [Adineta steineri]
MFALKLKSTENAKKIRFPLSNDILRKITFIEQSLTYPEAIRSLTLSNMFICAREGDFILDQLNFFNSNLKDNNEMQGCAPALFDGQPITRSTCHGRAIIENKSLCICVGPIGSKWIQYHIYNNWSNNDLN